MKSRLAQLKSFRLLDTVLLSSFFLSGICALMYQVAWQRSLYSIIGVDIDSITIIVSVFMLGIGFGGMLGGWIADLAPKRRIHIYAVAELAIALYGFSSLLLVHSIDDWLVATGGGPLSSGAGSLLFLIVPTTFMGMTLPLLTMVFNDWQDSIGVSVGQLYFINTLGAATGAGLVPFVLLPLMPLDNVIHMAAFGNLTVAALALLAYAWQTRHSNRTLVAGS
ncbi:MAG: fused MFS/spermidine synthase [Gammaproteobacteria bacterium]|nr:fused MFS/spermidine synthase [Gammaproteobacteria bacterium]